MVLGRVYRTAWDTKLLLTAVLASLLDCISSCHLLKAQHCFLSLNWCFSPSSAFHQPQTPPTRTSPIDSIHDITGAEKTVRKTISIQVASRIT